MARSSAGEVNIVKPLELQRKMRQIIDNPVIATDVEVSFFPLILIIILTPTLASSSSSSPSSSSSLLQMKLFLHPSVSFTPLAPSYRVKTNNGVATFDIGNVTAESDLAVLFQPSGKLPARPLHPLLLSFLSSSLTSPSPSRSVFPSKFKSSIASLTTLSACASSPCQRNPPLFASFFSPFFPQVFC